MKTFNIYITGVGGQGIGLLSQTLLRAIDYAGVKAIAVDTHGLAQRGGVVVSRIRCGEAVHSPLMMKKSADLVLGMEIHEAMRGLVTAGKEGGLLYFWMSPGSRCRCDSVRIKRFPLKISLMHVKPPASYR